MAYKEIFEIFLTQNKIAIVDAEDYAYLNQFKWYAFKHRNTFYAVRWLFKENKQIALLMHREILKPSKNIKIDHINRNGLDNRKCNLRICNNSQNMMNREKQCNNSSGYKGVCWVQHANKWMAQIGVNKQNKYLGYYSTKEECAEVYNEAAKKYHGEFAELNRINYQEEVRKKTKLKLHMLRERLKGI